MLVDDMETVWLSVALQIMEDQIVTSVLLHLQTTFMTHVSTDIPYSTVSVNGPSSGKLLSRLMETAAQESALKLALLGP